MIIKLKQNGWKIVCESGNNVCSLENANITSENTIFIDNNNITSESKVHFIKNVNIGNNNDITSETDGHLFENADIDLNEDTTSESDVYSVENANINKRHNINSNIIDGAPSNLKREETASNNNNSNFSGARSMLKDKETEPHKEIHDLSNIYRARTKPIISQATTNNDVAVKNVNINNKVVAGARSILILTQKLKDNDTFKKLYYFLNVLYHLNFI